MRKTIRSFMLVSLMAGFVSLPMHDLRGQASLATEREAALRSEVVRAIVATADSQHVPLRIDPLPLPSGDDAAVPTTDTWRELGDSSVLAGMSGSLRAGLRLADESVRAHCGGTMVAPAADSSHKGCPKETVLYAVIGAARPGGTLRRPGVPDVVEREHDYWSVRVLLTYASKGGVNQTTYDFVLSEQATGWKLIRRVGLLVIE